MDELAKLQAILGKHSHMNFVQRILEPGKYPRIDNSDGSYSTHLMADAEYEGKPIVFPTIIQYPNGKLKSLELKQALHHAVNTGEYIQFDDPEEASWFSQNYKKVWEQ